MKVIVLYRPNSDHGRVVDEFSREFQARNPSSQIELMNIDSQEGSNLAGLYDVMDYPAIMVMRTDGSLQHLWQGAELPLVEEVAGYANA